MNAATEEIVAVEALVRWRHPERGVVQPHGLHPRGRGQRGPHPHRGVDPGGGVPPGSRVAAAVRSSLRMSVNISARQLHDEDAGRHGAADLREPHGFDPRSPGARDHGDGGDAGRAPHRPDPRRLARDGRARRARRLRHRLLVAEPPRAPAHLHREDRPVVRARPAGRARARRGGRLGDRPRPSSRPDGGGRGRRDRRRARRAARRRLRRHPGLPLQQAGAGGGVRGAPRGGSRSGAERAVLRRPRLCS